MSGPEISGTAIAVSRDLLEPRSAPVPAFDHHSPARVPPAPTRSANAGPGPRPVHRDLAGTCHSHHKPHGPLHLSFSKGFLKATSSARAKNSPKEAWSVWRLPPASRLSPRGPLSLYGQCPDCGLGSAGAGGVPVGDMGAAQLSVSPSCSVETGHWFVAGWVSTLRCAVLCRQV